MPTKNYKLARRLMKSSKCAKGSFRTLKAGHRGRTLIRVCCLKRHWKKGRCNVGMRATSILKRK